MGEELFMDKNKFKRIKKQNLILKQGDGSYLFFINEKKSSSIKEELVDIYELVSSCFESLWKNNGIDTY